ncbi:2Fe-2S iron-sulfur cluster-binding protein [Polymorphum gilvum]|uniref:Probable ferredoxin, 2fe-2s fdii electron transport iron-sulfur protein n=1 Tax=Polymorphum gilvum (strain LMG 25793 / CGMCC 1.9160 / SL003B-26A1) TaxID=991905 RepID=F2J6L8_POLGS|nr:2Fe-2S iron-sulfur cluster-binding protein [Polymorphum gilvum]ADZ72501.1 Probable ferredoxin, 2fe-2s fdii electron transport iron-sulfur protein [Polymorphum gilvum SL003B-26A1]
MTINLVFIDSSGARREITSPEGQSLMETATMAGIPGIDADCGGACACATCQVYVAEEWVGKLPPIAEAEANMLEFAANRQANSRLACQIRLTPELDGLTVTTPEFQF